MLDSQLLILINVYCMYISVSVPCPWRGVLVLDLPGCDGRKGKKEATDAPWERRKLFQALLRRRA